MIHTQYYALMRALSAALDSMTPNNPIQQWDYNFNSITFDQLKIYDDIKALPKGVMNINSTLKQPNLNERNYRPGFYAANLVETLNAYPVAKVENKYYIIGLYNFYTLNIDVTIRYETTSQMLDHRHAILETIPQNFYYYDFTYDYMVYLSPEIRQDFDPYEDESENIYAYQLKDDASNFDFFSKITGEPILKLTNINSEQDKNSDVHELRLSFEVQDTFLYQLMTVDWSYYLIVQDANLRFMVEDFGNKMIDTTPQFMNNF